LKAYLEDAKTKADEAEEAYKKAKAEHTKAVDAKKAIDDEIVVLKEYAEKVEMAADKAEEEYKKALDWTDGEVQQKAFERTEAAYEEARDYKNTATNLVSNVSDLALTAG
jgi:predicted  nucleic acid-binding Zn-ribbon protein